MKDIWLQKCPKACITTSPAKVFWNNNEVGDKNIECQAICRKSGKYSKETTIWSNMDIFSVTHYTISIQPHTSFCKWFTGYERQIKLHCSLAKYGNYSTLAEAQSVCDVDYNCEWVYDHQCDDSGVFYLCPTDSSWTVPELGYSEISCVYRKGIFNIAVVFSKSTMSQKCYRSLIFNFQSFFWKL